MPIELFWKWCLQFTRYSNFHISIYLYVNIILINFLTGHCHCDEGFGPPFCNVSGPGGSLDSGSPMQKSNYLILYLFCVFTANIFIMLSLIFRFKSFNNTHMSHSARCCCSHHFYNCV